MKSDKNGCSSCKPNEEKFEVMEYNGREYCQYEFRNLSGALFTCVKSTLEKCRIAKDKYFADVK